MDKEHGTYNLNSASAAELADIPGLDEKLAQKIVDSRPFSHLEELRLVKGMSGRTFKKITPWLVVSEPPESLPDSNGHEQHLVSVQETELAAIPEVDAAFAGTETNSAPASGEIEVGVELSEDDQLVEASQRDRSPGANQVSDEADTDQSVKLVEEGQTVISSAAKEPATTAKEAAPVIPSMPIAAKSPVYFSRGQTILLILATNVLTFFSAVVVVLLGLFLINGNLIYAGAEDFTQLSRQVNSLNTQMVTLAENVNTLYIRLQAVESLGSQVEAVQREVGIVKEDAQAAALLAESLSSQMENVNSQVAGLTTQVEDLQTQTNVFSEFLTGLQLLLEGLP
jgi:hypothetical protein